MIIRSVLRAGAAALAILSMATLAHAQEIVAPPTPNADALAAQMRVLTANPRDLSALIAAGDLSTRIGDLAAALGFFGRAAALAPADPRIAAGRAGALVMLERPGEALRLYAQAEAAGAQMTPYLSQRGLAYDLIGQPGNAQRDYRAALRNDRNDETVRRLALSLGISGERDEAMALLDPLLRRSDRAAWRARACIVAMGGDTAGAQKIATSMMPGGAALTPFFGRLPALSPADRAFAVHFGDLKPSVARANDARLAPTMAAPPAVAAPTRVVQAEPAPQRPGREPIVIVALTPTPAPPARAPVPIYTLPPQPAMAAPRPAPVETPAPTPTWAVTAETVKPKPTPAAVIASPAPPPPAPRVSSLASIIETITVPESELIAPPPVRTTLAARSPVRPAELKPTVVVAAKTPVVVKKKPEPRKPEPAKADPPRWWVQVAGGARASDLDKDWRRLTAKSAALKGKGAYTTPLRSTNRLLTGPFKTEAEARGVVNALAKEGASAFTFQSAAGQKIDKLGDR